MGGLLTRGGGGNGNGPGFIYLMCWDGLYKIGCSHNPRQRLASLDVRGHRGIELIHEIPCNAMRACEQALHEHYADRRRHGEWFALSSSDVAWICAKKSISPADFDMSKMEPAGDYLKPLRLAPIVRANGLTVSDVQRLAGISMGAARRYWYGTRDGTPNGEHLINIDLSVIDRISKALGVRPGDIF
jgi:hypothetical protein